MGMDECWIDISGRDMTIEKGTEIAHEIRERIKFETGLTISVGVPSSIRKNEKYSNHDPIEKK